MAEEDGLCFSPTKSKIALFIFFKNVRSMFKLDELGVEIAQIAFPAALALTADPIVSLVDTAFIGRIGPIELAAVVVSIALFNQVSRIAIFPLVSVTTSFVAEEDALAEMSSERYPILLWICGSYSTHQRIGVCFRRYQLWRLGFCLFGPLHGYGGRSEYIVPVSSFFLLRICWNLGGSNYLHESSGIRWLLEDWDRNRPLEPPSKMSSRVCLLSTLSYMPQLLKTVVNEFTG